MKKKMFALLFSAIFTITMFAGCGKGNTLVCNKDQSGAKLEAKVTFKNDRVSGLVETVTFSSEEEAQLAKAFLTGDGIKSEVKGKKVTVTFTGDAMIEETGGNKNATRADVKKAYENSGFTCK